MLPTFLYTIPKENTKSMTVCAIWWKHENKANCFSAPFMSDHLHCSHLLGCYNTAPSHQKFLYSSELNETEKVCISKNEMGTVQTKKKHRGHCKGKRLQSGAQIWVVGKCGCSAGQRQQKEEQIESKKGKAYTDNTAVEIHFQSPLNAFQKVHSRLTVERCSLIHSL